MSSIRGTYPSTPFRISKHFVWIPTFRDTMSRNMSRENVAEFNLINC